MPENARLLQLLQENEQTFMEVLFHSYFPLVCKTIYRLVQDTQTAEDLAQEVFIKIWNRRDSLQDVYFKAYLHKAAINMALDYMDKNKRRGQHMPLEESIVLTDAPSSNQSLKETNARVQKAINDLPEKCREIFILSRFEEMTYRQIADTLKISVKTVENQMITALKKLRVSLQDYLAILIPVALTLIYTFFAQF